MRLEKDRLEINFTKMIEQTELVVTKWDYHPPANLAEGANIQSFSSLDVMRKRASTKKGIACRLSGRFVFENETILEYVGEDSYVIDFDEVIDKKELLNMIRNSFSKFQEKFDFRKLSTVLRNRSIRELDESKMDLDAILPLLV